GIKKAQSSAERLGIDTEKIWRHNGNAKVPRPLHVALDGTPADENGLFNVNGDRMEAPGLGTDPAQNVNCSCSVEFRIKKIDDGLIDKDLQGMSYEDWQSRRTAKVGGV